MAPRHRRPRVSIVVPACGGKASLAACLKNIAALDYPRKSFDVIIVMGPTQGLREYRRGVRVLRHGEKNVLGACNLGIRRSRGKYVALLDPGVAVERSWLTELVAVAETNPKTAGIAGRAFGRVSLQAGLFRRRALLDIGLLDEDFVVSAEDSDLRHRLNQKGWELAHAPRALCRRGKPDRAPSGSRFYFGLRGRLLFLAKHFPSKLGGILNDPAYHGVPPSKRSATLRAATPDALAKLRDSHSSAIARKAGARFLKSLGGALDAEPLRGLRMRWQVMSGERKTRIGIYDHALHFVGGGQKYALTMADALRHNFQIEYITNLPVATGVLSHWHGLALDFPVKVVPLASLQGYQSGNINPGFVREASRNPFDAVSRQSSRYDIFVNANMLTRVRPRAGKSVFVCHFPDQKRDAAWYVDHYDLLINNSAYGARWTRALWGLKPHLTLTPPIDMNGVKRPKRNIILSVSRFEESGSKKQLEMIAAFAALCRQRPEIKKTWRLVLCGGSLPRERYIKRVAAAHLMADASLPIDIMTNIGSSELRAVYAQSKIFWHLCGLDETAPERIEHFGMTTVEAMQNHCVPIVFNGGGQKEIVEHGRSGFLINSSSGLRAATLELIKNPARLRRTAVAAWRRSKDFSTDKFRGRVREIFGRLEAEYKNPTRPVLA